MVNFFIDSFIPVFLDKLSDLFLAPFNYPEMFWILFPLITTVILMELYFGRYPREDLGYHAALENTVFLLFVAVDLIRYLISSHEVIDAPKIILIASIVVYAIIMGLLDFFHKLPRKVAFKSSSKAIISFTAYVGIILVYSNALEDTSGVSLLAILVTLIIMFFVYMLFINFIRFIDPEADDAVEDLLHNVEEELDRAAKISKKRSKIKE